ncbi:MAG TPA: STN and carboxypeptidase regulatory-like domain-containing protein, partial [Bacteroidales bacterium]
MKYWYLLLIFVWNPFRILAQDASTPVLERLITVNIVNEPLPVALETISRQGNFVFSYNPDAIRANQRVSISVSQKPVRHVLNELFKGSVTYKVRGRYIILRKNDNAEPEKKEQVVEGYVYDSGSGQKLTGTTVYDKDLLISAVTDKYGYFKLELPTGQPSSALHISKEGYVDTLLTPLPGKANYVNIELSVKTETPALKPSSVSAVGTGRHLLPPGWLFPKKIRINTRNLTDTVFRKVQFSVLPFVSTNKLLTGSAVNNVSVNLTAGYVQGVRNLEIGGVLNIVKYDAGFCQLAGVGNMVGRSFKGFQG